MALVDQALSRYFFSSPLPYQVSGLFHVVASPWGFFYVPTLRQDITQLAAVSRRHNQGPHMNLNTSFTLRFRTLIANHPFLSEIECRDFSAVRIVCGQLFAVDALEPVAALMYFNVLDGGGGTPDDISERIFAQVCEALKAGQEEFWNATMGSYDQWTNRVTPVSMGTVFPDGTVRIVWDEEQSVLGFDDTLRILDNALWLLLRLQKLPQLCASDEDYDNDLGEGPAEDRRINILFEAGLWPDESGAFPDVNSDVREVLKKHST